MSGPSSTIDFPTLLRLLDDDTPEVRRSVAAELSKTGGDVSDLLVEVGTNLGRPRLSLLSELLHPARRERLRREWLVPGRGLQSLHEDWDHSESMLRAISDFLHDGVTLRQSLGDAIDLLAEEYATVCDEGGARELVEALFAGNTLRCDNEGEVDPRHLDLAAVASGRPSNAVGCGMVVLLVARRLGAPTSAINLPGSFLLVCDDEHGGTIHDPSARGREVDREDLLQRASTYPPEIRMRGGRPASPGELVLRVLEELATSFAVLEQVEDATLIERLIESLGDTP